MKLTPAIKGKLTKAIKGIPTTSGGAYRPFTAVRSVFEKIMPREQAKHATRKYLATQER